MKQTLISFISFLATTTTIFAQQTAVGTIGGSFAVSDMGAATYTIPIEVPQGINGMQPNIALTYNSQSGNGVCGLGFSISGLSAITRIPRSIYYDGVAKGIKYDATDAYALDGKRLLLIAGTEGKDGAKYGLEGDMQTEIILHGSGTNQWWEVKNGGVTMKLGNTYGGRMIINSAIVGWNLENVTDTHNNAITYSYFTSDNCKYLSEIKYGENSILFTYDTRVDPIVQRIKGVECKLTKQLAKITSKVGTQIYREYELQDQMRKEPTRITCITQRGTEHEYFPNINIAWNIRGSIEQTTPSGLQLATKYNVGIEEWTLSSPHYFSGDVTGDGLDDVICVCHRQRKTGTSSNWTSEDDEFIIVYESYLNNGKVAFRKYFEFGNGATFDEDKLVNYHTSYSAIDFYGDGIKNFVIPGVRIVGNSKQAYFQVAKMQEKKCTNLVLTLHNTNEMPLYTYNDYYNCGRAMVCCIEKGAENGAYRACIIGFAKDGKEIFSGFSLRLKKQPQRIFSSDYDGDGMQDILILYNDGYVIYWNQGVAEGESPFSDTKKTEETELKEYYNVYAGDFNGDAKEDYLLLAPNSNDWKIAYSRGNGRFDVKTACTLDIYDQTFTDKDNHKFNCQIIDFNGDGKQDIVVTKAMYNKKKKLRRTWGEFHDTYTYWLKSTGTTLEEYKHTSSKEADDALRSMFIVGDFDGNGYAELMNNGYNCYAGSGTRTWHLYNMGALATTDKIHSITTTSGKSIVINYAPITNSGVYSKGVKRQQPIVEMPIPLPVVRNTIEKIGRYDVTTTYKYSGLKVHQHKGLLGFESVSTECNGTQITNKITAWNNSFYLPQIIERTTQTSNFITKEKIENTYTSVTGISKYALTQQTTTTTDIYNNITTTENKYSSSIAGVLTSAKTTLSDGSYSEIKYNNYVKAGDVYRPRQVVTTQKHADDKNAFTTTENFTYSTSNGELLTTECNEVKQTYTYDTYGNILSHTTSAKGISPQTERFEYDATHRFVTKYTATDGIVNAYTYDKFGNCTESKDITDTSSPLTTKYQYDSLGRLVKITSPEGIETIIHYSITNNAQKATCVERQCGGESKMTIWYDNIGREVESATTGACNVAILSQKDYNAKGLLNSNTVTEGNLTQTTKYTYDVLGRMTSCTQSDGGSTNYSYSNRQQQISRGNQPRTIKYDALGNIRYIVDGSVSSTYTYASCGKPSKIVCGGAIYNMQYDAHGRKTLLSDPNAGTTQYEYDALGRITKQTDARGTVTTYTYNARGLITEKKCGGWSYMYTYNNRNLLTHEQNGDCITKYTYDKYCRISGKNINTFGHVMNTSYTYDMYGRLQTTTYPDGTKVNNIYDSSGNVVGQDVNGTRLWNIVVDNGISRKSIMPRGSIDTKIGADGRLQSKAYTIGPVEKYSFSYTYNNNTGNITSKTTDFAGVKSIENYTYDTSDRLLSASSSKNNLQMTYAPNGNILSKTDMGKYTYNNYKPHAVAKVENSSKLISHETQEIIYAPFNKVERINETVDGKELNLIITYGPDDQRVSTELSVDWETIEMRYYMGNFEQVIDKNGKQTNLLYITSPDGLTHIIANGQIYYALTDHLGSVVRLYKNSTDLEFATTYDVWGASTTTINKTPWLRRGFTMHEHWPEFGLIDMNGRFYDPQLGRFLSPDPYVQAPDNPQNFNRYSYCLNNPLKYTDPSGEIFTEIFTICAMAYMGGIMSNAMSAENPFNCTNWNWKSVSTYTGIASGALSGAGMCGYSFTLLPKVDGIITRGAMMGSMSVVSNGIGNISQNKTFWDNWLGAAISGFVNGAIEGYCLAEANGTNLWWGNEIKWGRTKWSFVTSELPYDEVKWNIKDASRNANDCVVATIVEANNYLGGDATYEQVAKDVGYVNGVGTELNLAMYEKKLSQYVNGYPISVDDITNLNIVKQYKNQGGVISVNMPHKMTPRHADNIRSIKFYKSGKVIVRLRIGSYNANTINDNWHFYLLHSIK